MKKLSKQGEKLSELVIIILIGVATFFLWNTYVIYPIKIFVVFLHEMSHAIAAYITGGDVKGIVVSYNLGGVCKTTGGNQIVIASAGYLGSLVFGSLLFISSYHHRKNKILTNILSVMFVAAAFLLMNNLMGSLFCIIIALILFISPRYFNKTVNSYIMKILGFVSCLYVWADIKADILTMQMRHTDAHILERMTGINHIYWGIIWIVITVVFIFFLIKYGYNRGVNKK